MTATFPQNLADSRYTERARTARPVRQHRTGLATPFRFRRKEGVTLMVEHNAPSDTCSAPTCDRPPRTKGMCDSHYARTRLGIPLDRPLRPHNRPASERLWRRLDKDGTPAGVDECWNWPGATTPLGYGQIKAHGVAIYTHRVAYESLIGDIPNGLVLDHLCHNRACCNPWHLDPVTQAVNVSPARARRKARA